MHKLLKISFLLVVFFGLYSCDSNKVYEEYIEVEDALWQKENIASFKFLAEDTIVPHNLYINIRNTGDYAYSNLYLFVTLQGPDGNLLKDTVNCKLADKSGKWLGKGIGDLWDLQMPYIGGFKFAQKGEYTFSLEQAMRVENGLDGITDVGLRVETAD
ncbi:MAG: gliding motility lipoprotein GldH [Vicingaceae bacterium]|nr:gliding motility lipoprotein GldH [Vicingaceae bacterium]